MILTDRINTALAGWLGTKSLGITCQSGIEAATTTESDNRIICLSTSCEERSAALRGVYNCGGEVLLRQSIDSSGGYTTFKDAIQKVRNLLGNSGLVEAGLLSQDGLLHVYNRSWHLDGLEEDAGKRGWQATFTWRCVARDSPTTT